MLDTLNDIDVAIFRALNGSLTSLDTVMWWASQPLAWTPLYLVMVWAIWKKFDSSTKRISVFIGLLVCIGLTDLLSARVIKPTAARLRPSHQVELASDIHLHQFEDGSFYKGGKFSFVSSHAANHMGVAVFCGLILGGGWLLWLVVWALLIGYSRVHLGVHFPGDVLCGWMLGAVAGGFVYSKIKTRL